MRKQSNAIYLEVEMEAQKTQETPPIVIKEEISDTSSCGGGSTITSKDVVNNATTQRGLKTTKSAVYRDSNENIDCSMRLEINSASAGANNIRNSSSPKNNSAQYVASNAAPISTILKSVLTNFSTGNTTSFDNIRISPPLGLSMTNGNNSGSEYEQSSTSLKSFHKMKRLLSTLSQFASVINTETGESVKALIFNLVCNTITIEEFHANLQEATNFPLRPFVLPFLKNYIPILQKEVAIQAKLAKQHIQHYVRQHENCVFDSISPASSELYEIFNHVDSVSSTNQSDIFSNILSRKRRYECHENNASRKSDSPIDAQIPASVPAKKYSTSGSTASATMSNGQSSAYYANDYFQVPPPPQPPPFLSSSTSNWLLSSATTSSSASSKDCHTSPEERKHIGDNEWNNIYVMLNCILSMVEKTKRALAILQERENVVTSNDGVIITNGINGEHGSASRRHNADDVKRTVNELLAHTVRLTEEKVAYVRRKAEEAVNEVKRQAMAELQKAVMVTDYKTFDYSSHQFGKSAASTEKKSFASESDFHAHNGTAASANHINDKLDSLHSAQTSNCWNCGRKAQETCSGCGVAKYCGSFCQYKDWESHHQICNGYANASLLNFERYATVSHAATKTTSSSSYSDTVSYPKTSQLFDVSQNSVGKPTTSSIVTGTVGEIRSSSSSLSSLSSSSSSSLQNNSGATADLHKSTSAGGASAASVSAVDQAEKSTTVKTLPPLGGATNSRPTVVTTTTTTPLITNNTKIKK